MADSGWDEQRNRYVPNQVRCCREREFTERVCCHQISVSAYDCNAIVLHNTSNPAPLPSGPTLHCRLTTLRILHASCPTVLWLWLLSARKTICWRTLATGAAMCCWPHRCVGMCCVLIHMTYFYSALCVHAYRKGGEALLPPDSSYCCTAGSERSE